MDSEASCRSATVSEDELERCDGGTVNVRGEEDEYRCCCCCECASCPPHLFTSILLGLLACVLVSGGVFLAFHKWDHTWLLVSAVGILLMAIGTALHCCSTAQNDRKGHRCKGGCGSGGGARSKPDTVSNGILSEQLLPLSNARSVSQLSLNMVPGYFPPLVYPSPSTPYGLEQHSAVVQNISRLVQHQQQLHLQSPSTTDGARSFILLPLPADANAANIQNLVAAVCQLDSNNSSDHARDPEQTAASQSSQSTTATTTVSSASRESSTATTTTTNSVSAQEVLQPSASQPMLKHVEVQTCSDWPNPLQPELKAHSPNANETTSEPPAVNESTTVDFCCQAVDTEFQREDCLILTNEPHVQEAATCVEANNVVCDIGENPPQLNIPLLTENSASNSREVPVEVPIVSTGFRETECALVSATSHPRNGSEILPEVQGEEMTAVIVSQNSVGDVIDAEMIRSAEATQSPQGLLTAQVPSNDFADSSHQFEDTSGISDLEDSELLARCSPPPSYDDVTQDEPPSPLGAFRLAYGTL